MKRITQRSDSWLVGAGLGLICLTILFTFSNLSGQADGPTPRTADGHPDLSGRYVFVRSDPGQENPVFKPATKAKYISPMPKGACVMGGTPTSITVQTTKHGPLELVQRPGVIWILTESPQSVIWVPTDGRPNSKDPDDSFIGESVGRWDGDTLVIDTVGIETKMKNVSVGLAGEDNAWIHSDKEHVIQRFSRPSKNSLVYQLTVEDPVVLTKPFTSTSMHWSLTEAAGNTWKAVVPEPGCDF
jgi:hypothetical protein